MKLTSGYYFFQSRDGGQTPGLTRGLNNSGGYVLIRPVKNMLKIQCIAEHLPPNCGPSLILCLWDSLNIEKPFTLGRMILRQSRNELRGEMNFTVRAGDLSPVMKFDGFALIDNNENVILHTPPEQKEIPPAEKERPPFDPFNTTNPAYSWDRAESIDELKLKLGTQNIRPLPEIAEEIKNALSKYRHVLLGNYKPLNGSKNYYIIGVTGDRPPAGEEHIYRWINKCVSLEEYPFFEGYKLYYFDGETGAVVKAILRT